MDESSIHKAPSSLCCKTPCRHIAALPCASCENAPSTSGDSVPPPSYCSKECADSDWPRHKVDCLASRERRALFDAAKGMQRLYYTACEWDLDFAVDEGYKIGTDVHYDPEALQRRMYAVSGNKQFSDAFLACFGGYNPILKGLYELTSHLKGLNVRIYGMTLRMKRVRGFSFDAPIGLAMDEHKVIKATTENGESYALDIAGAQFGLYTVAVPWKRYVDLHVCKIQSSEDIVLA